MTTMRRPGAGTAVGVAAVVGGGVLLGAAVLDAARMDAGRGIEPAPAVVEVDATERTPSLPSGPGAPGEANDLGVPAELAVAVAADPFRPERRPPPVRYRLPREASFSVELSDIEPEAPEPPAFRVVGTAVMGRDGAALVQVEGNAPRLLALGESLLGYTLEGVDAESATLVGETRRLRLPVTEALLAGDGGPDAPARRRRSDEAQRGRSNRGQNADRAQQVQQIMERLRVQGRRELPVVYRRGGGGR